MNTLHNAKYGCACHNWHPYDLVWLHHLYLHLLFLVLFHYISTSRPPTGTFLVFPIHILVFQTTEQNDQFSPHHSLVRPIKASDMWLIRRRGTDAGNRCSGYPCELDCPEGVVFGASKLQWYPANTDQLPDSGISVVSWSGWMPTNHGLTTQRILSAFPSFPDVEPWMISDLDSRISPGAQIAGTKLPYFALSAAR